MLSAEDAAQSGRSKSNSTGTRRKAGGGNQLCHPDKPV
jgi:hypothetical protein